MKPYLILVSHGLMAEEALHSAEMIVGEIPNVQVVSMRQEDGLSGIRQKLDTAFAAIGDDPVLVMADLWGGTPCNVVTTGFLARPHTALMTGFNLASVIEYADNDETDLDTLTEAVIACATDALRRVSPELLAGNDDDDEIETD